MKLIPYDEIDATGDDELLWIWMKELEASRSAMSIAKANHAEVLMGALEGIDAYRDSDSGVIDFLASETIDLIGGGPIFHNPVAANLYRVCTEWKMRCRIRSKITSRGHSKFSPSRK